MAIANPFEHNYLLHPSNRHLLAGLVAAMGVSYVADSPLSAMLLMLGSLFFRAPHPASVRGHTYDPGFLYSPCYGTVTDVITDDTWHTVSVFMSVFDVHVQYAPCAGTLVSSTHIDGSFEFAQLYRKTRNNTRRVHRFRTERFGEVDVVQVAGFLARTIVSFPSAGARMQPGDELGLIRFGSRVDIRVPVNKVKRLLVREGDIMYGPYSKLAVGLAK